MGQAFSNRLFSSCRLTLLLTFLTSTMSTYAGDVKNNSNATSVGDDSVFLLWRLDNDIFIDLVIGKAIFVLFPQIVDIKFSVELKNVVVMALLDILHSPSKHLLAIWEKNSPSSPSICPEGCAIVKGGKWRIETEIPAWGQKGFARPVTTGLQNSREVIIKADILANSVNAIFITLSVLLMWWTAS